MLFHHRWEYNKHCKEFGSECTHNLKVEIISTEMISINFQSKISCGCDTFDLDVYMTLTFQEPGDLKDMMMKVFREGQEGLVLKDVNVSSQGMWFFVKGWGGVGHLSQSIHKEGFLTIRGVAFQHSAPSVRHFMSLLPSVCLNLYV